MGTGFAKGSTMRIVATLAIALLVGGLCTAFAQQQTEEKKEEKVNCSDVVFKHLQALTDATVREQKPRGACAIARWGVQRHQELLRSFNLEPEECRKEALGKDLEKTLKVRISQETRLSKRHCKR
jgi:hypothetical protein